MKTLEIEDEVHEILVEVARQRGMESVATFICTLQEVKDGKRANRARQCVDAIKQANVQGDSAHRFFYALHIIHKFYPQEFASLDGFTKPNGGKAVFISRRVDTISETSQSARPIPLGQTGFLVNVQGGDDDHEYLIRLICGETWLRLPISVCETLIDLIIKDPAKRIPPADQL